MYVIFISLTYFLSSNESFKLLILITIFSLNLFKIYGLYNSPYNDDIAICKEPVDSGSCTTGATKRFYFDEEHQTCRAFIYTGCGGNRNRFKTFESCINTCLTRSKFGCQIANKFLVLFLLLQIYSFVTVSSAAIFSAYINFMYFYV